MRFLLTRRPEVDEFQDVVPDEFQVSMSLRASARTHTHKRTHTHTHKRTHKRTHKFLETR